LPTLPLRPVKALKSVVLPQFGLPARAIHLTGCFGERDVTGEPRGSLVGATEGSITCRADSAQSA
jgi:hypothetical protein